MYALVVKLKHLFLRCVATPHQVSSSPVPEQWDQDGPLQRPASDQVENLGNVGLDESVIEELKNVYKNLAEQVRAIRRANQVEISRIYSLYYLPLLDKTNRKPAVSSYFAQERKKCPRA